MVRNIKFFFWPKMLHDILKLSSSHTYNVCDYFSLKKKSNTKINKGNFWKLVLFHTDKNKKMKIWWSIFLYVNFNRNKIDKCLAVKFNWFTVNLNRFF